MTARRWMALSFALGSTCFLVGPFPGYAQLVGDSADAITFFVGSILFTVGGALQSWLAWAERSSSGRRPRRVVVGHRPVGRHALLQRHDVPGDARGADELGVRQARLATRLARVDLLPRVRGDRLSGLSAPSGGTAGCRRVAARDGGSRPSTSSAASSSASRPSPDTSFPRPAPWSTWPRPTGTRHSGRHASSPARSTRCAPARPRRCRCAGSFTRSRTRSSEISGG